MSKITAILYLIDKYQNVECTADIAECKQLFVGNPCVTKKLLKVSYCGLEIVHGTKIIPKYVVLYLSNQTVHYRDHREQDIVCWGLKLY